ILTFFFVLIRLPPVSTLFPYTTLFRSCGAEVAGRTTRLPHMYGECSGMAQKNLNSPTFGTTKLPFTVATAGTSMLKFMSAMVNRSEEHTSELQSRSDLVCRLLLEKKKK